VVVHPVLRENDSVQRIIISIDECGVSHSATLAELPVVHSETRCPHVCLALCGQRDRSSECGHALMNNWPPMTSAYDSLTTDRDIQLAGAVVGGSGHASAVMDARRTMRTCMGEVVRVAGASARSLINTMHTSCKACMGQVAVAGRAAYLQPPICVT
jgi:hypothetical protein